MTPRGFERRWRDALLDAMIPAPGDGLPPLASIDRREFWPRFERAAPWAVQTGFRVATGVIVTLAPFLLGYRRTFTKLDAGARDDVLRRTASLPGGGELLEVVKIVACFAYFADDGVQETARGTGR